MQTINENECCEWFRLRGVNALEYGWLFQAETFAGYEVIKFQLPIESGKKVALAYFIIRRIYEEQAILLSFRNWDVWRSCGHKPLMTRLRQSLGHEEKLEDKPCQKFNASETNDAISFLLLGLIFFGIASFHMKKWM